MKWGSSLRGRGLLVFLPVLYFLLILIKTSWICDDAYITFRTVDNFVHGFGLRWNIADRVETFTNPLWMLVVSALYSVTGEIYYSVTVLMFAASLAAVLLLCFKIARSKAAAILGILILATSKAFTDYSTSGLENPLTHLLVAAFLAIYHRAPAVREAGVGAAGSWKSARTAIPGAPDVEASGVARGRELLFLSLLFSLAMVNRMDTGLLLAPALIAAALRGSRREPGRPAGQSIPVRRAIGAVAIGMLPFWIWEGFSILYYGFPFPNSAYAKLGPGLGAGSLLLQGLHYLWSSVRWDPLTPLVIAAALLAAFSRRIRTVVARGAGAAPGDLPVALGIVLYLLYVARIGGDFMSGRFLAAPLLCSVAILCRMDLFPRRLRAAHLLPYALAWALGFLSIDPPILSGPRCGVGRTDLVDAHGVSDERAYYYQGCGLLRAFSGCRLPCHFLRTRGLETRERGRSLITAEAIGLVGFYGGPGPHFIDFYGLADPFVARLPLKTGAAWRIGHLVREIPEEYLESVRTGRDLLRDARLRRLYEDLTLVTRGPLLSRARFWAILRVNFGGS